MHIPITKEAITDLTNFGKCLIHTNDLDPIYPLMKNYAEIEKATEEQINWIIFIYMYWYALPSVIVVFNRWKTYSEAYKDREFYKFLIKEGNKLPIGTERRAFRGNNLSPALIKGMKFLGNIKLTKFIKDCLEKDKFKSRKSIEDKVQTIPYWGPWSGFKVCDLYQYVIDYPLSCSDMSLKGRTQFDAFRHILTVDEKKIEVLDKWGLELEKRMKKEIPNLTQDILETIICKFHAMNGGFYAVGFDIWADKEKVKKIAKKYPGSWEKTYVKMLEKTFCSYYQTDFCKPNLNSYKNEDKIKCPICGGNLRTWFKEGGKACQNLYHFI